MFEKGHPGRAPYFRIHAKTAIRGLTKRKSKYIRELSAAIQEDIPPDALIEFHMAIVSGHNPTWVVNSKTKDIAVTWNDSLGDLPNLKDKRDSVAWLTDRGYGKAVESIHLKASITDTRNNFEVERLGMLSPDQVEAFRAGLRLMAGAATNDADVIDDDDDDVIDVVPDGE